ncbi:unnamed protein product [Rotaria sp. Silwood1]|nr:unnamed protein product [Rotaria sp. Silwood1]CAF1128380.1 unnamed protein product [Rotaria sp. Silwood1]CAF3439343.1 unnamed protein product [Rotaria sp. Silwood1]CAF3466954.1 unnamed protein product [Rotaria sp. Silwood1]CAF4824852.1 unnamed protein product [Rotaria sp. Silwood1]
MGPKRADTVMKGSKLSQGGMSVLGMAGAGALLEQDSQQCVGKFAADLELCCREPSPAYPITIPVHIRGRPPSSALTQSFQLQNQQQQQPQQQQQQHTGTHSGMSATPSLAGVVADEQLSTIGKKTSRSRMTSVCQSGVNIGITGTDGDIRSSSNIGQEQLKISSPNYKTFHLINDSDFFRPKLLVDSVGNDNESIDQITTLYIRDWQLDQRFIDILKKVLPLQEQLHTLDFCYVGLNEKTIHGIVELCQVTKNLKNVSLDGNPLAAEYFYLLLEKDDSKIIQLSLRYCNITDTAAERLAFALGNMLKQNRKLLTLNLSGNRIGDNGAKSFATALRYNRTLISLNLSSNFITDKGACHLALVLRRIVLTQEEILRRRYLIVKRYIEIHPDEFRISTNSPTPSNVSTKSKSGRSSRADRKRVPETTKRKTNISKTTQHIMEKRNRNESDESRPPSESKGDLRRARNEGSSSRAGTHNPSSATPNTSRRTAATTLNTSNKESDQSRTAAPSRMKKIATTVNVTAKKNITIVKEEDEDAIQQGRSSGLSSAGKTTSLSIQQIDGENPLLESSEIESQDGDVWLKGNLVLLSLNLSRNYLTSDSVREFLLSVQQQSALASFNDAFNLSSSTTTTTTTTTTTSLTSFFGLCRLELKGMNDISTKSPEYQSLEALLAQKSPLFRFQQFREREAKELFDLQSIQPSQQLQQPIPEKTINVSEKTRVPSSAKPTNQRPTSRLKD